MKIATEREFKLNTGKFLSGPDDTVVTRRGKPVAMVTPMAPTSTRTAFKNMGRILKQSGIGKKQLQRMLEDVRTELFRR